MSRTGGLARLVRQRYPTALIAAGWGIARLVVRNTLCPLKSKHLAPGLASSVDFRQPSLVVTDQKLKDTWRSMLRFAAGDEKNPPASELDFPNRGDSRVLTGGARFTLLKTFRVIAAKFSE